MNSNIISIINIFFNILFRFLAEEFKVISGTIDLNKPFYTHYVSDIYVHENFSIKSPWVHDIALLKVYFILYFMYFLL